MGTGAHTQDGGAADTEVDGDSVPNVMLEFFVFSFFLHSENKARLDLVRGAS